MKNMNFFLSLLYLYYFLFYPSVGSVQVSSKLDFDQKGTYKGEPLLTVGRAKNPIQPFNVYQFKENEDTDAKPLTTVCISTGCKQNGKTTVIRKPEILVQVLTESDSGNSNKKYPVDVPDVPVVVGTKGVQYYSNFRNTENFQNRRIDERPPIITEKVYVPLFGSSVLVTPRPSRNYRSTTLPYNYPSFEKRLLNYGPYQNSQTNNVYRDFNRRTEGKLNSPDVKEILICNCRDLNGNHGNFDQVPQFFNNPRRPLNPNFWNNFIHSTTFQPNWKDRKPGIDDKLLPLD